MRKYILYTTFRQKQQKNIDSTNAVKNCGTAEYVFIAQDQSLIEHNEKRSTK